MKLARLGPAGHEIPALIDDDGSARDLRSITAELDGQFFQSGGVERVRAAAAAGTLPPHPHDAATARIGAPIARPSAVYCVGMNYAAHAAESGSAPPENLVMFMKSPNTVIGPNDTVRIPTGSSRTDWEVELGVVIGSTTHEISSIEDSAAHIAGYMVVNDLSERTWQIDISGGQWSKGKSAPGFAPTGPWLVTPDEVVANALRLRSWVNGQPRQDSTTADMLFSVDYIVWHLSQFLQLEPGDLILTGTPQGVALSGRFPYLSAGDVVELSIDGLGTQRQEFVQ